MSGQQDKARSVSRTYDSEVTTIQSRYLNYAKPLGQRDDRSIGRAERKVCVFVDQFGHPRVVVTGEIDRLEVAAATERRNIASTTAPASRASR